MLRPAIHLSQNVRKRSRNMKNKKCVARCFASLFCVSRPFFHILHQGRHSHENAKDSVVYFFVALIKHEIRMKCEKCVVSVLYFIVCFAKIFAKYQQNAKYEKCIAALRKYYKNFRSILNRMVKIYK